MVKQRETLAAVVGVLAFSAVLRADMMPVSPTLFVVGMNESLDGAAGRDTGNPRQSVATAGGRIPSLLWTDLQGSIEPVEEIQPVQVLAEDRSSLALCLSALLGFGAFRSLSCVKKLSFGFIPYWYHSGAPAQIGQSFAIAPDCFCSTQVGCFVQPVWAADDLPPQYDRGTLPPLLRKSLFTPAVLGPRPPPLRS